MLNFILSWFQSLVFIVSALWHIQRAIFTGNFVKKSFIDWFPPGFWFGLVNPMGSSSFRNQDLSNHVIVVTGANTGVGRSSACALVKMGATVILACRDVTRGNGAVQWIERQRLLAVRADDALHPHAAAGRAVLAQLDLSDLHSVKRFVPDQLQSGRLQAVGGTSTSSNKTTTLPPIRRVDVLICNAGLNYRGVTVHRLQQLFQVNYLGHHLLAREMMPLLQSNDTNRSVSESSRSGARASTVPTCGRVVCLSSLCHHLAQGRDFCTSATTNTAFPPLLEWYHGYYDDSKYYMNLLALEINRRYAGVGYVEVPMRQHSGEGQQGQGQAQGGLAAVAGTPSALGASQRRPVTAVCANPGAVRSDIWRSIPAPLLWLYDTLLMRPFFLTVDQGAATSVYGALVPLDLCSFSAGAGGGAAGGGGRGGATFVDHCGGARALVELPDNPEPVVGGVVHPFMPYLVPYPNPGALLLSRVPKCAALVLRPLVSGWGGIVTSEVMSVFVGPQWGAVSLPHAHITVAAGQLWEYSVDLCDGILQGSGGK